jgi:hypothetical protein
MYLTNFMVDSGIKQDALRRRRFASVDVGADADVAVTLDGGLAGHYNLLEWTATDIQSVAHTTEFKGSLACDMMNGN